MAFMKFSKGKGLLSVPNGIGDGSAYFNKTEGVIANVDNLPYGNSARTISCWIYISVHNTQDNDTFFSYGYDSANTRFGIGVNKDGGSINVWGRSNTTTYQHSFNLKQWYHAVITFAEDYTEQCYIDGVLIGTQTHANINTQKGGATVGRSANNSSINDWFYGNITDINVYNRVLSADEVTALYNKQEITNGRVLHIPLQYGKDDESLFSSKSFVYDTAILTTSSGFDEWGYPIRYDIASECGIAYKGSYYVPNDEDTLILYQPRTSDTEVVNYAKGASQLLYEPKNYGVTVADGKLQFDGNTNSYIEFPSNSFPGGCFDTLGEFTVDMWFDNQKTSTCCLFGTTKGSNGSSRMDWLTNINTGEVPIGGFKNLKNSGEPYTKFRLTLEVWNDNGNSVFSSYVNGKKQNSGSWTLNSRTLTLCLGYDNETRDRYFKGTMAFFSIRAKADHKGVDFEVKENPYA